MKRALSVVIFGLGMLVGGAMPNVPWLVVRWLDRLVGALR